MRTSTLRIGLLGFLIALLLSCGGGGGSGGGVGVASVGIGGVGTPSSEAGGAAAGGASSGTPSEGQGGLGIANADSATSTTTTTTTTASGDDGSGVGSGGTGVTTADAVGVGAVDGAGSIIVNGLRYDTTGTVGNIQDAPLGLQIGMSAKVTGPTNADFTQGVARLLESAADLRGPLASVDLALGGFNVLGTSVTTDAATVWADASGLAALTPGQTLQIWGLPAGPGVLRATRVEQHAQDEAILTGTVQSLDTKAQTFRLGGLLVDYSGAALDAGPEGQPITDGTLVRVRGNAPASGQLKARLVQWWYPVPRAVATALQLAGVITDYAGIGSLRVLGVAIDASAAALTGGPATGIGNGVYVEIGGVLSNNVLKATQLRFKHVPGTGGPASFTLIGTVGAFRSTADFRVKGQPVNAAGPDVQFTSGTAADLRNGAKVTVHGDRIVNGVLQATEVGIQ